MSSQDWSWRVGPPWMCFLCCFALSVSLTTPSVSTRCWWKDFRGPIHLGQGLFSELMNSLWHTESGCWRGWLKKEVQGEERQGEKCMEGKRRGKNPPLLKYTGPSISAGPLLQMEGGGRALAKNPQSLILIKKHKEHQRPTPNLYQSGAPQSLWY